MLEVGSENFENEVVKSDSIVVVDFWGPQCGPCLALMPQVEELAQKYAGKARVVKLDSSKNRRLCISLKVISLPTFLFYKDGQEVGRLTGNDLSIQAIEEKLGQVIGN